jgi:glycosyltransferase involved in cell wall biosynthesis
MRILHTETSLNWGGQEMRILEQVRWLNSHGHEAWVAARTKSEILKRAKAEGLPCFDVPFRGHANPISIGKLFRLTRKHAIDVIDCHSSRDATHCSVLHLLGATVVRSLHLEFGKNRVMHRLVWKHGNDRIVVVSEILRQRLVALGHQPTKIDVINEGIDLDEFDCRRTGEQIRNEFHVPVHCKIITNIGMIRPDKGQQYFVASAEAIAAAVPDVRFMIVGEGTRPEFETELQARVQASPQRDKFIFTGYRTDIAELIAASDCVVVASLQEAHSRVVPQAFAMRRPVVATRVGGLPDLVKPGVTGTLVAPANPEAIASAVIGVLNRDMSEELDHAYAMAQKRFGFDLMMQHSLESYEHALAREAEPIVMGIERA